MEQSNLEEFKFVFNLKSEEKILEDSEPHQSSGTAGYSGLEFLNFALFSIEEIFCDWNHFVEHLSSYREQENISSLLLALFLLLLAEILKEKGFDEYDKFWRTVSSQNFRNSHLNQRLADTLSTCADYHSLMNSHIYSFMKPDGVKRVQLFKSDHLHLCKFFKNSYGVVKHICNKYIAFEITDVERDPTSNPSATEESSEQSSQPSHTSSHSYNLELPMLDWLSFYTCFQIDNVNQRPISTALLSPLTAVWSTQQGCLEAISADTNLRTRCCGGIGGKSSKIFKIEPIPQQCYFLTGSNDSYIRLWAHANDMKPLITCTSEYIGHSYPVTDVVCCKKANNLVASASFDTTVRLWDLNRASPLRIMTGHFECVNAVKFHQNPHLVASASSDCSCRLFDTRSGNYVRLMAGNKQPATCVASIRDRYLLSCHLDGTIVNWDISSGQSVCSYKLDLAMRSLTAAGQSGPLLALLLNGQVKVLRIEHSGQLSFSHDIQVPSVEVTCIARNGELGHVQLVGFSKHV